MVVFIELKSIVICDMHVYANILILLRKHDMSNFAGEQLGKYIYILDTFSAAVNFHKRNHLIYITINVK